MTDHYTLHRAALLTQGGHDAVIDFLTDALAKEYGERALAANRERMQPDYQAMTPHDLQARVAKGLGVKA